MVSTERPCGTPSISACRLSRMRRTLDTAICVLIAVSSVRLIRESLHALMEGVPHGLSVDTIGSEMASVGGVLSVHDLHVWMLSGSRTALSAHVVVHNLAHWEPLR